MCGLYGWNFVGDPPPKWHFGAALLAHEMDDRGGHSWGVFGPGLGLVRGVGRALGAVDFERVARERLFIGHTRWATQGDVTEANAHPFRFGRITGAHNGVVYNHYELQRKFKRTFEVDSMHIFAHLDERLPLKSIEAYGAMTYHDEERPGSVYLSRFNGGQLVVVSVVEPVAEGEAPRYLGVVWASTDAAVTAACRVAGVQTHPYRVDEGRLFEARDGIMWSTDETVDFDRGYYGRWENYSAKSKGGRTYQSSSSTTTGKSSYGSVTTYLPDGSKVVRLLGEDRTLGKSASVDDEATVDAILDAKSGGAAVGTDGNVYSEDGERLTLVRNSSEAFRDSPIFRDSQGTLFALCPTCREPSTCAMLCALCDDCLGCCQCSVEELRKWGCNEWAEVKIETFGDDDADTPTDDEVEDTLSPERPRSAMEEFERVVDDDWERERLRHARILKAEAEADTRVAPREIDSPLREVARSLAAKDEPEIERLARAYEDPSRKERESFLLDRFNGETGACTRAGCHRTSADPCSGCQRFAFELSSEHLAYEFLRKKEPVS